MQNVENATFGPKSKSSFKKIDIRKQTNSEGPNLFANGSKTQKSSKIALLAAPRSEVQRLAQETSSLALKRS